MIIQMQCITTANSGNESRCQQALGLAMMFGLNCMSTGDGGMGDAQLTDTGTTTVQLDAATNPDAMTNHDAATHPDASASDAHPG
jgi:hypothetical protein